jgi:pimeloyl-ACP methyl ester carboxylesterase
VSGVGRGVAVVDGVRLAYRRAGTEGPPVVLLHGAGVDDSGVSYGEVVPALAEDHRVYALDWPDYGDSGSVADHSTATYAALLAGFLEDRDLDHPTVVGLSMGGAAALQTALDRPELVGELVLAASYGLGKRVPAGSLWYLLSHTPGANAAGWTLVGTSDATVRSYLATIVADVDGLADSFVESVRERAAAPGAGEAFARFQRAEVRPDGTVGTDLTDRLGELSVPTRLVHGRHDPVFPVEWSRRAREAIPAATLTELDCGHWLPRERPAAFETAVREATQSSNMPVER